MEPAPKNALPRFEPPTSEEDAIAIAKRVMEIKGRGADRLQYEAHRSESGWDVDVVWLPRMPGGHCFIQIRADGTIASYRPGR